MPDDVSKTPTPETAAQPPAAAARPKREAHRRPDVDPVEAGRDFMDRHPIVMARLAE